MSTPRAPSSPLPPAVVEALRAGDLVRAIKLLRTSGIGLKEAKDLLENYTASPTRASFPAPVPGAPLPATVVEALQQGNKIEAIRRLRELTGLGLKEAKDAVDGHVHTGATSGLSPGQMPDSSFAWWWIIVAAIGIAVAAWFFR